MLRLILVVIRMLHMWFRSILLTWLRRFYIIYWNSFFFPKIVVKSFMTYHKTQTRYHLSLTPVHRIYIVWYITCIDRKFIKECTELALVHQRSEFRKQVWDGIKETTKIWFNTIVIVVLRQANSTLLRAKFVPWKLLFATTKSKIVCITVAYFIKTSFNMLKKDQFC